MTVRGAGSLDPAKWPALVLTAGLATRLQPLSSVRAKAALPVAGEALVMRILKQLAAAGIRRVVLNLHHRAESITRLVGDGTRLGLAVRYSWESEVLGSAGGPARAIPLLEADRFLIVNGDTLADVDLAGLAAQHVDTNALVTMVVVAGRPNYNGVIGGADGIVRGFGRDAGAMHFIGIQAVNASAFAGVSPHEKSETVHGMYPPLITSRPEGIRMFRTDAEFFDIGSPRDYLDTAITIAGREGKPLDRGQHCRVAPDAVLSRSILWDRVTVGAGAQLSDCVAADGVTVPPGAKYSRCSLVMRENEMVAVPWNLA
jgi:NDP-sugar pyrophosphorylase family protein